MRELLGSGRLAVASAKDLIRSVSFLSLEEAVPLTAQWMASLRATPEAREGMGAFLDKRQPNWVG